MEILITFDTTGSMSPCIRQVRKNVVDLCKYLFDNVDDLKIGIIAHGDWCDGDNVITKLGFVTEENKQVLFDFVNNVKSTYGGDAEECYEYVMHICNKYDWQDDKRVVIMIGDDEPHDSVYIYNRKTYVYSWKKELNELIDNRVNVYPIQALNQYGVKFWQQVADIAGTVKLNLPQFADINDILMAIVMKEAGKLTQYTNHINSIKVISPHVRNAITVLSGKKVEKTSRKDGLVPVSPSRFQVLHIDEDCSIKDFVQENDLSFNVGRGFYEFTSRVTVQDHKEVIVQDIETGDMFNGEDARKILGIPKHTCKVSPSSSGRYRGFIQSTSANRKLLGGTYFLYEV